MRVRVVKSFSDIIGSYVQDQEIELPENVDWLKAGLVEAVENEGVLEVEKPAIAPQKPAQKVARSAKTSKDG